MTGALFLLVCRVRNSSGILGNFFLKRLTPSSGGTCRWPDGARAGDCRRGRLSGHTVRWALKQLFAKTGTKRQAELVKLLLSGLAGLAADSRNELH